MNDPRKGVPSASGIERIHLCPGSWLMEKDLPPSPPTEDSMIGDRVHHAWATGDETGLSVEERETVDWMDGLESQAVNAVFGGGVTPDEVHREKRLWYTEGGRPLFSGQLDVWYIHAWHALILDGKTGRNETAHAEVNMQLRAQAVLLDLHTKGTLNSITVGIVSPWQEKPLTLAKYLPEHLNAAFVELTDDLEAANDPASTRIPSEKSCQYCRAKANCREAIGAGLSMPVAVANAGMSLSISPREDATQIAKRLTNQELGACLDKAALLDIVQSALKDECRARLERGDSEGLGRKLTPGRTNKPIVNPLGLYARLTGIGVDQDEFIALCSVAKGELKELVAAKTGRKGKELSRTMDVLLDSLTEEKQTAATLEKI